ANVRNSVVRLKFATVVARAEALTDAGSGTAPSIAVNHRRCAEWSRIITMAAAASTSSSGTPRATATTPATVTAASRGVLIAVRPSAQSACATIAITTGLTPYSTPATSGSDPYLT